MRFPARHSPLVATLLIALAPSSFAQSETTAKSPTLAQLKGKFLQEMRKEIAPAGIQYVEELRKLERKFAQAGEFEAAIAARDERAAVVKFLNAKGPAVVATDPNTTTDPAVGAAAPEPGRLHFADTAANISGGAIFGDDGLQLSVVKATASWKLGEFEPGGYEIIVNYTSAAATGVQAKESFFRLSGELPSTGGARKSESIGTLKITGGSDTVSLTNTGDDEGSKLIIHSIDLISAKDQSNSRRTP